MRFERGKDPKETMSIGNKANPIEITGLYGYSGDVPSDMRESEASSNLTRGSTHLILNGIEKGQIRDWKTRFMAGVYNGMEETMINGAIKRSFELRYLGEFSGYYVKYDRATYKLQEKDEISER